jgi:hypothetical protein
MRWKNRHTSKSLAEAKTDAIKALTETIRASEGALRLNKEVLAILEGVKENRSEEVTPPSGS